MKLNDQQYKELYNELVEYSIKVLDYFDNKIPKILNTSFVVDHDNILGKQNYIACQKFGYILLSVHEIIKSVVSCSKLNKSYYEFKQNCKCYIIWVVLHELYHVDQYQLNGNESEYFKSVEVDVENLTDKYIRSNYKQILKDLGKDCGLNKKFLNYIINKNNNFYKNIHYKDNSNIVPIKRYSSDQEAIIDIFNLFFFNELREFNDMIKSLENIKIYYSDNTLDGLYMAVPIKEDNEYFSSIALLIMKKFCIIERIEKIDTKYDDKTLHIEYIATVTDPSENNNQIVYDYILSKLDL